MPERLRYREWDGTQDVAPLDARRFRSRRMNPPEEPARRVQDEIRRILLGDWDPIGVHDVAEASDEYDSYVGAVYRLLASSATAHDVAGHLRDIEVHQMGLASELGGLERLEPVAEKLLAVDLTPGLG